MQRDEVLNSGAVLVMFLDEAGKIYASRHVKNKVVDTGLAHIAARLADQSAPSPMSHMAIGRSSTAQTSADTALLMEAARVPLQVKRNGAATTYTATFPAGMVSGAVAELGIFNAASSGVMLARVAFAPQVVASGAGISVSWTITQIQL